MTSPADLEKLRFAQLVNTPYHHRGERLVGFILASSSDPHETLTGYINIVSGMRDRYFALEAQVGRLREALKDAMPYLDNKGSPGGCDGKHHKTCLHCAAIRRAKTVLKDAER